MNDFICLASVEITSDKIQYKFYVVFYTIWNFRCSNNSTDFSPNAKPIFFDCFNHLPRGLLNTCLGVQQTILF